MSPRRPDERGLTLVELLVSMVVLGFLLVLGATAMISLFRTQARQTGLTDAQAGTRQAFLDLDRQVRYADAVSSPGTAAGSQYVEWRLPDATLSPVLSPTRTRCYQWRASPATGLLQFRSWPVPDDDVAAAASGWKTVARGLVGTGQPVFTVGAAALQAPPFSLPVVNRAADSPLRVGVVLSVTQGTPPSTSSTITVFTALNSGRSPLPVCAEVARS